MSEFDLTVATPDHAAQLCVLIASFRDHLGAPAPSDGELEAFLPLALRDPASEFCLAALPQL